MHPDRSKHITASDAAAALGLSPYRTAFEVWAEKTGRLDPESVDTEATRWGSRLEPIVLAEAADRLGCKITGTQVWRTLGNIGATLDAETDQPSIIEAKTAGIVGRSDRDDWGEEGTDQIPPHYVVQAQTQLLVTGLDIAWVPVLIGARGFRVYRVERDAEACELLREQLESFWCGNVLADVPPAIGPDLVPTAILRRLRRVPGSVVDIDSDIAKAWQVARGWRLDAEKAEELAASRLALSLGDAEAARFTDSEGVDRVVWWREENAGRRLDTKAVDAAHPGLLDQFKRPQTRRVWRVTTGAES